MASSRSALNFNAVASEREKPRSSSTSPRVTCVTALIFLAIAFLLRLSQLGQHQSQTGFRNLKIAAVRFPAALFKGVQHVQSIADPRQVKHSVPRAFVGGL